jgi:hypothetical protein
MRKNCPDGAVSVVGGSPTTLRCGTVADAPILVLVDDGGELAHEITTGRHVKPAAVDA